MSEDPELVDPPNNSNAVIGADGRVRTDSSMEPLDDGGVQAILQSERSQLPEDPATNDRMPGVERRIMP